MHMPVWWINKIGILIFTITSQTVKVFFRQVFQNLIIIKEFSANGRSIAVSGAYLNLFGVEWKERCNIPEFQTNYSCLTSLFGSLQAI